ncbi:MAG: hypothetical protein IAX21_07400 [Candidatus Bathyarchaeota archaeon]|nr:MAG: hypothetical protein IAX21_07400 [Candidatus Bathyarchaeota archaeon]
MALTIPALGSAVYVLYLEHGPSKTLVDLAERETLGWLNNETGKDIYIQHVRTVDVFPNSHGSANGIRIPINSIIKICVVDKRERE